MMTALAATLSGCAPKPMETPSSIPGNPFDYSRSDSESLIEFGHRFGKLPDSAKMAVCREMDVSQKEKRNDPTGLTLHQGTSQILFARCSPVAGLQERLKSVIESSGTPIDQKQYADFMLQLIIQQENQLNAQAQCQKTGRTRTLGNGGRKKSDHAEKESPALSDSPKPSPQPTSSDDVARKKLEALRNLEKSMDRGLTP